MQLIKLAWTRGVNLAAAPVTKVAPCVAIAWLRVGIPWNVCGSVGGQWGSHGRRHGRRQGDAGAAQAAGSLSLMDRVTGLRPLSMLARPAVGERSCKKLHGHLYVDRRCSGGPGEERLQGKEGGKEPSDPIVLVIKIMVIGSMVYCAWIQAPLALDSMVESGAALMRSDSPLFATTGMARVRRNMGSSRRKCEAVFGQSGEDPNKNICVLLKLLESQDPSARSEALDLSLRIVEIGCSSILADAGASDVLKRLKKEHGADPRVGNLLSALISGTRQ